MKYFIDEINGNDINFGTSISPKKSITNVIKILKPGDEIYCLSDIHINKFSDLFPAYETVLNIYFNKHTLSIYQTLIAESVPNNVTINIYQAKFDHKGNGDNRVFFYRTYSGSFTRLCFYNCIFDRTPYLIFLGENYINGLSYAIFENCVFLMRVIYWEGITLKKCLCKESISSYYNKIDWCLPNIQLNEIYKCSDNNINSDYGIYSGKYSWNCKVIILSYNNKKFIQNNNQIVDITNLKYEDIFDQYKILDTTVNLLLVENNKFNIELIKEDL